LSEEDQKLKDELDMLVERLGVCWETVCGHASVLNALQESDSSLYKPALDAIKDSIKTSTSSMTAVPKPLKFLRPHYEKLEEIYESWPEGDDKVRVWSNTNSPRQELLIDTYTVIFGRYTISFRHDIL
jgi:26S proteasome regulatory subunit N1